MVDISLASLVYRLHGLRLEPVQLRPHRRIDKTSGPRAGPSVNPLGKEAIVDMSRPTGSFIARVSVADRNLATGDPTSGSPRSRGTSLPPAYVPGNCRAWTRLELIESCSPVRMYMSCIYVVRSGIAFDVSKQISARPADA